MARKVLHFKHKNLYPNGLIELKGDVRQEMALVPKHEYIEVTPLTKYFQEEYFIENRYYIFKVKLIANATLCP